MEYVVGDLRKDDSQGHNFRMIFGKSIPLELAVSALNDLLLKHEHNPTECYVSENQYTHGHITLGEGCNPRYLTVEDEKRALGFLQSESTHDTYKVTENNMSFSEFENIFASLKQN